MAERKATNKYYPPDWDPSKGSVNKHKKSHPLRDRARKIDQGILIIRFEMPFDIWCLQCDNHVGMGVRFNAEKSTIGSYYTSPIYKFRMKCHLCDNHFELKTDPAKFDYVIISGARKHVKTTEDETDQIKNEDEERKRRVTDAMFRLEKKVEDQVNSEASLPDLRDLKRWRSRWDDNFAANQIVRSQYRQQRKSIQQAKEKDKKLLRKASLRISLVKPDPTDTIVAKSLLNRFKSSSLEDKEAAKRQKLINSSILFKKEPKQRSPASQLHRGIRIKRDPG